MSAAALPSLAQRVVLITGSGGGLGRELAIAAAGQGATVILHGRDVKKLEAVYDEITEALAPMPFILPLDFATATGEQFAGLAHAIQTQVGRLDAIIHNAAMLASLSPIEHQTFEHCLSTLRVNLAAPLALTRSCFSLLTAASDASVIFTLDSRGQQPKAFWGSYAASKAGLGALVQVLADEWQNKPNLRVNGVIPGPIHSPMRLKTHPGEASTQQVAIAKLVPLYLHLLATQTKQDSGKIWDMREWLAREASDLH